MNSAAQIVFTPTGAAIYSKNRTNFSNCRLLLETDSASSSETCSACISNILQLKNAVLQIWQSDRRRRSAAEVSSSRWSRPGFSADSQSVRDPNQGNPIRGGGFLIFVPYPLHGLRFRKGFRRQGEEPERPTTRNSGFDLDFQQLSKAQMKLVQFLDFTTVRNKFLFDFFEDAPARKDFLPQGVRQGGLRVRKCRSKEPRGCGCRHPVHCLPPRRSRSQRRSPPTGFSHGRAAASAKAASEYERSATVPFTREQLENADPSAANPRRVLSAACLDFVSLEEFLKKVIQAGRRIGGPGKGAPPEAAAPRGPTLENAA